MTTSYFKYIILNNCPKFIYKFIFSFWKIFIKPFYTFFRKRKLKKFEGEYLKNVNFSEVSFKIYLNKDNGLVDNNIFLHGVYEPYYLSIIKKELKVGDTFVDIGANIGQHSLFASRLVGESGKVISFEPIFRLYNQLKKSVHINNFENIKLYNVACGKEEKDSDIFFMKNNYGGSSILANDRTDGTEKIKIIRGDNILKKEDKINFIKIDVEGYEYYALKGIEDTISKHKPKILIEFTPSFYEKSDATHSKKIISFLLSYGYKIFDLEKNTFIDDLNKLKINKENPLLSNTNFLCKV